MDTRVYTLKEHRPVKAADIGDERFLLALLETYEASATMLEPGSWTCMWDFEQRIPGYPWKLYGAKAAQLIKRGLMDGCTCGCRGDFELTIKGLDWLHDRGISGRRLKAYARGRGAYESLWKWKPATRVP